MAGKMHMATPDIIVYPQTESLLTDAQERNVPVCLAVDEGGRWRAARGESIRLTDSQIQIPLETSTPVGSVQALLGASDVFCMFTMFNHNHRFRTPIVGLNKVRRGDEMGFMLIAQLPQQIDRATRRSSARAYVPPEERFRAAVWPGGCEDPDGKVPPLGLPVWSGTVLNVSNGGLQMRTHRDASIFLQRGDVVGIHLWMGARQMELLLEASICHSQFDGSEMALIGVRFTGVGPQSESREGFAAFLNHVREFQTVEV